MINLRRRYFALAGAVALAGGLALTTGPAAHATTADCLAAHGSHCGTFSGQDNAATPNTVYWDDKGRVQSTAAVIIGYSADSTADPATDFTLVQHIGKVPGMGLSDQNTVSYSFVYTPRGAWTNLCISDPNNGQGLGLRVCNGLQYQRFIADRGAVPGGTPQQVGPSFNGDSVFSWSSTQAYALQNAASRQFVTDGAPLHLGGTDARQLSTESVPTTFGGNQIWTWLK